MSDSDLRVSISAIGIAFAALIVAFGQFLQQVLATADGYTRCGESVIGDWSRLVDRRFRWRAFRVETMVVTPHFVISSITNAAIINQASRRRLHTSSIAIDGTESSMQMTMCHKGGLEKNDDENEDMVTWTSLIHAIHKLQWRQGLESGQMKSLHQVARDSKEYLEIQKTQIICLKLKIRSWDLMPPDVVRPLASTTLGSIIIMAHRMGMIWKDLRPSEGKLRAEGLGQGFSATLVRGLGIVVEYAREPGLVPQNPEMLRWSLRIPSVDADKMSFGIIPGNRAFGTWDIHLRADNADPSLDLIYEALIDMDVDQEAYNAIRESVDHRVFGSCWPAFADIVGLWPDWLPLLHSGIASVFSPIGPVHYPMIETCALRIVLSWHLQWRQKTSCLSPQLSRVLVHYETWASRYRNTFFNYYKLIDNRPEDLAHRNFLETIFNDTTDYFAHLELKHDAMDNHPSNTTSLDVPTDEKVDQNGRGIFSNPRSTRDPSTIWDPTVDSSKQNHSIPGSHRSFYAQLVCAHVNVNAHSLREADVRLAAGQKRNDDCIGRLLLHDIWAERAFVYADNAPLVVEDMKRRGFATEDVEDAWWTLMLRGQCWATSNSRIGVKYEELPSHYYGSPTKVYIL